MMTESKTKILVWDAPVRVFHWLMVLSFAGAYLTAESERWRLVHVSLGYTMGGLVAFRILWGLLGTRHARFASFVRGPAAVMRYGRALLNGTPEHHVGHNPAGAVAIVLLLLARLMVDTGRPALPVTHWALVFQTWAYVLVVAGIWFTISPWRLRDMLNWGTANEQRIKVGCGLRLAFGLFVAALGVTKF